MRDRRIVIKAINYQAHANTLLVILSRRMTPLAALIAVPVLSALIGGFGLKTAGFMTHGIQSVAAVAGMFLFTILYFGITVRNPALSSSFENISQCFCVVVEEQDGGHGICQGNPVRKSLACPSIRPK